MKFEITITCHDMYGIEIYDDGTIDNFQKARDFLKMAVTNNHIDDEFYKMKDKVNPFLQSDTEMFVMIEFWTKDFDVIEKYIDFLNLKYKEWN